MKVQIFKGYKVKIDKIVQLQKYISIQIIFRLELFLE